MAILAVALWSCTVNSSEPEADDRSQAARDTDGAQEAGAKTARADERAKMVREQIEARGVRDPRVLAAMRAVPRHEFMPESERGQAYEDRPLPIGRSQTISQPYIVAAMTELLDLDPGEKVLEVGTGSGYQAAVLAELGAEVYSIEIIAPLGRQAARDLERLGYRVNLRIGDGYRGWPEAAPFDAVIVTAAPDHVPEPLVEQLKVGGRMMIPVGRWSQRLVLIRKDEDGLHEEAVADVRFVPMTGEAQED
jgi:protein-L-isoaspartate(D-aspartate) O-methyltransferase